MDYETAKLLFETDVAVRTALDNTLVYAIVALCLVGLLAVYVTWLAERWSWVPRKRHERVFVERF